MVETGPEPATTDAAADDPGRDHRAWLLATALVLVAGGLVVADSIRLQWFFMDEWSYLDRTPSGQFSIGQLFVSHNGHVIVWTNAWFQLLEQVVGLRYYLLYGLPILVSHLVVTAAGISVSRSLGAQRWLALLGAVPVLLMAAGARNIVWAGQFQYVAPVALFVLWTALRLRSRPSVTGARSWVTAALVGLGGCLSSLVWLPLALVLAAQALVLRRRLEAAVLAAPAVLVAAFGIATDPHGGDVAAQSGGLVDRGVASLHYAVTGLTAAGALGSDHVVVGAAVLVLGWLGILLLPKGGPRLAAVGLGTAPVVFFLVTSVSRASLGAEQATQPRYLYVALACLVPLWVGEVGVLVARAGDRTRAGGVAAAAVAAVALVVLGVWSAVGYWREATYLVPQKEVSHGVITAAVDHLDDPRVPPLQEPEPYFASPLHVDDLRWLVDTGRFYGRTPTAPQRQQAAVNMLWVVQQGAAPAPAGAQCRTVRPGAHTGLTVPPDQVLVVDATSSVLLYYTPDRARPGGGRAPLTVGPGTTGLRAVGADAPAVYVYVDPVLNASTDSVTACLVAAG